MPFSNSSSTQTDEYQLLVNAVLSILGLDDESNTPESTRTEDVDSRRASLVELLEGESHSAVFKEGISYVLLQVAGRGLVWAAEVLMHYSADPNHEDPMSTRSPLHIAVQSNRPSMVRFLVEHGADIEKRDIVTKSSPLDFASEYSKLLPCMKTLLNMGADVNASNIYGQTPLLHALDQVGQVMQNTENIELLLQRGANVNMYMFDDPPESPISLMVLMVENALEFSPEEAVDIGNPCLKVTKLLLAHGLDPSSCQVRGGQINLTQTSLEHFDTLFPLAVLILQSGASFACSRHGASCWSGYSLLFQRLQRALERCSDDAQASELFEQADRLLDMARFCPHKVSTCSPKFELSTPGQIGAVHSCYTKRLLDFQRRVLEQEVAKKACPPSLQWLCGAFIGRHLQPWPLDDKVMALPLPDRMKDYLLPERKHSPKPGWDSFKSQPNWVFA